MSSKNLLAPTTTPAMASSSSSIAAVLTTTKNLPDVSKIEPFNGEHFKRWQDKIYYILDVHNLAEYLTLSPPEEGCKDFDNKTKTWTANNKICRYTILSALSCNLYDIYYTYKNAYEIWNLLSKKYIIEEAGSQQYFIGDFLHFRMVDNKPITNQIHDYHRLVDNLKNEGIILPARFLAGCLIEKLPESWNDYIKTAKHKKKHMSLEDVIVHIKIEKQNRLRDMARNHHFNANVIETKSQFDKR